eukprot:CAMPEP_0196720500 /NCGR_PEP_ID=MMETSP1091-20130531/3294_1 /TAXON_ID=302021 /ORGANISM="Rhodomonas sp., Strain CCMP768" /LENGTH=59 /DNA_ID=CAMNT_0042061765 /DNA_START=26 /DNA_END=205 /DNA_ORIENTATION=+
MYEALFSQLYAKKKDGEVDLKAIAAQAGACKHFCPSKWAKVGGMLQMDGTVKFAPGTDY